MQLSALVDDLKTTLKDAAGKFSAANDADFTRLLKAAAVTFGRKRPRTLVGSVDLVAEQSRYTAPADFMLPKAGVWGRNEQRKYKPWDNRHPGRLPGLSTVEEADTIKIVLTPAPTQNQINIISSSYEFFYFATHTLSEDAGKTTIRENDRDLLLLLATIGAMTELANSGTVNPIQLHRGMGSQSKGTTAAAWVEKLINMYEAAA
ncbi:MAG: hypothetical protein COB22_07855 [Cycloclasticus sp.]|nr:MAG: hypothetical protein COB22_07855 [Cycloclasticus sp.]